MANGVAASGGAATRARAVLRVCVAASSAVALASAGCDAQESVAHSRPIARLGPPPGQQDAPFAVLARDRRGTLFDYPVQPLAPEALAWDRSTGTVTGRASLPPELGAPLRVELLTQLVHAKSVTTLSARIATVALSADGTRSVSLDLTEPALVAPPEARLQFRARAGPEERVVAHETDEILLPAGATLEAAFGFLPSGQTRPSLDGETRFSVSLCEESSCEPIFSETATYDAQANTWHDRTIVLDAHTGRRVRFRLAAEAQGDAAELAFPLWSVPTLYARDASAPPAPSLLLISLDTLRADHLGAYGYARETSPFIDREIAGQGTLFERAYSTATSTAPSHMSMFTGLPPAGHAVYGSTFFRALDDGIPTLAEVLHGNGFETGAVTEDGAIGAYRGFVRGFATYVEDGTKHHGETSGQIEETLAASEAWLVRHRDKRFFLFVHTYEVHYPYTPPTAFQHYFENDGVDADRARALPSDWNPLSYDREIRYTDARLEAFFARLEKRGLLDDTIVVLLSDHGEEFLEHGELGHGPAMYDEVLRVPLVARGPGIARGRRVAAPVSLVNLLTTLLDWLDVPANAPGASFAALARAEGAPPAPEERPIFSESRAGTEFHLSRRGRVRIGRGDVPNYAVRVGDRKLIRKLERTSAARVGEEREPRPTYQYFDLASDPGEQRDLWVSTPQRDGQTESAEEAKALRALIDAYIAEGEAMRAGLAETLRSDADTPGALDAERHEKLRALGYIE